MTSLLCYLVPLLLLAVALDFYFVAGLQRYRKLRNESIDKDGNLNLSKMELFRQAFWRENRGNNEMNNTAEFQRRFARTRLTRFALEWLLIVLIAYFYSANS